MDSFFSKDKKLHLMACLFIALIASPLIAHIPPHNPWAAFGGGVGVALIVGVWKEAKDFRAYGHFCAYDIFWDIVGAIIGSSLGAVAALLLMRS